MMSKIGINCDLLVGLYDTARRNGTLDEFGDLAVEWAEKADAEIDKLRAENEALRKLAREAADEIEGYVDAVYPANDRSLYPDQQRRYLRDMDLVNRIRDALRGEGE